MALFPMYRGFLMKNILAWGGKLSANSHILIMLAPFYNLILLRFIRTSIYIYIYAKSKTYNPKAKNQRDREITNLLYVSARWLHNWLTLQG